MLGGLIVAFISVTFILITFIIFAICRSSGIYNQEFEETENLARERLEHRELLLAYHYARRLIDREIANLSNNGDEVTINLDNSFLIRGKNIFDPSHQEITIRRLKDPASEEEPRPHIFFRVEGHHIRSHIPLQGSLERFINKARLDEGLRSLGDTKDFYYTPVEMHLIHDPSLDLDNIDQEILRHALKLCELLPPIDKDDELRYDNQDISIIVRDADRELPYQLALGFPPGPQIDILYHPGAYGPKLVYRHRFTHNLYLDIDESWLNAFAASYASLKQ